MKLGYTVPQFVVGRENLYIGYDKRTYEKGHAKSLVTVPYWY